MTEEYRTVPGFEWYEASNLGNVRSVDRWITKTDGTKQFFEGKVLKPGKGKKNGYLYVNFWKNSKIKTMLVQRVIAMTWVPNPNPNKYKCVNHINEIKTDNRAENLEWCDHTYNNNYGHHMEKVSKALEKPVAALYQGKMLAQFSSVKKGAEWQHIHSYNIINIAKHKPGCYSVNGLQWIYLYPCLPPSISEP